MWRTSHVGGHRFAPTVIDLPEGRYWGHFEPKALEKVERHVADAKEKSAKVVLEGERIDGKNGGGSFYVPTVLLDTDDSMLVSREETFGPMSALLPFDTEEDAIERANDMVYWLAPTTSHVPSGA